MPDFPRDQPVKYWLAIGMVTLAALSPTSAQTAPSDTAGASRAHGWVLYGLKQYREALADFTRTLQLDPRDYDATLGTGRCHRLLGDNDAAVADFTRAHELDPAAPRPFCERGAILILQGKLDASLADYQAAEKLDPNYPGLYSYFAEVYLYRREPEKALAAVQEGERHDPDMLIHKVNEAHSTLFLGDLAKAKGIYLANKNRIDPAKGITFAQIVLTDFHLLRTAGVTHPGMDEIETLMRAP